MCSIPFARDVIEALPVALERYVGLEESPDCLPRLLTYFPLSDLGAGPTLHIRVWVMRVDYF
jgi:hypothetical protein